MKNGIAALMGAIVVFAWASFSWVVLPWHNWDLKTFQDKGTAVTQAIQEQATASGFYMLPELDVTQYDQEKQKEWSQAAKKGPFVYMSVQLYGTHWDMNLALLVQFITQLFVASLCVWFLLLCNPQLSFIKKAMFISFAVSSGNLLAQIGFWNWWNFPLLSTLVNIIDLAIAWFFAGLVMSIFVPTKATAKHA